MKQQRNMRKRLLKRVIIDALDVPCPGCAPVGHPCLPTGRRYSLGFGTPEVHLARWEEWKIETLRLETQQNGAAP